MTSAAPAALTDHAPDRRLCIVLNAGSGRRGTTGEPEQVRDWAAGRPGIEVRTVEPGATLPEACRAIAAEGWGTLVAAGGDGTIAAVAAEVAGTDTRLGVLPLGTFNYFARAHGIPLDLPAALEVLETGTEIRVPVAEVNGTLFLNNASLGLYPSILRQRESLYARWGRSRLTAYWSVVRTVAGFRGSRRFRVTVDGAPHRLRTPMVFVALSDYQLEQHGLEGAEHIRDGRMAVFVAPDCGRWALLGFAAKLLARGLRRGRDFTLLAGEEVVIQPISERPRPHDLARDGEKAATMPPYRFRIRPEGLRLLVPSAPTGSDPA